MERRVLLCVDDQSLRNPAMIGLAGEPLDSIAWLECVTSAELCRESARKLSTVEEVWVVSCDDMEPINVAAALKRDDPRKRVYIISCGQNGSMASRVANAGIDAIWSESQFLKRFAQIKKDQLVSALPSALPSSAQDESHTSQKESQSLQVTSRARREGTPTVASTQVLLSSGPTTSKHATVIAVVSGTGGSGKSTLSAIMALLSARAGLKTVAVDADLQFGDLHHLLGVSNPLRIEEVIEEPARLERLVDKLAKDSPTDTPVLVAAPRRLEASEEVARELPHILSRVAKSSDVVVINTGAFWSDTQAMVFDAADAVVFVTDSRPSSLRETAHAVELCARIGVATTGFVFVVNRHEKTSLLSAVDVSCTLRGVHALELPHGGNDVDELLGAGYGKELLAARNPLVFASCDLLVRLLPAERQSVVQQSSKGRFKRRKSFFRGEK